MILSAIIRLGGDFVDYLGVKDHSFFDSINFDDLIAKKVRHTMAISVHYRMIPLHTLWYNLFV